ncbi:putative wd40 protein [Xylogone sp. PMI_703]|nr:putative wd40 protein [Xylogone sp. PMI_703]
MSGSQTMASIASPSLEEYQIGWICALPIEAAAAQEMLDENFGTLEEQDNADTNIYTLGRIGKHCVVIACLGGQNGTTSATTVANNMMRTFSKSLWIGLMVGIGGGIPFSDKDIRLRDIVISYPTGTCGGVLQHDMGKIGEEGKFTRTGSLPSPPRLLLGAVNKMRAAELTSDPLYPSYINKVIQKNTRTRRNFSRPGPQYDRLFQFQYDHPSTEATCDSCLAQWEVERDKHDDSEPQPHYGIIASGNAVIKHGRTREHLRKETGALCFEMEAAGLMVDFPCIVIRGICDYADSHKNKQWQGYAALAAASYTKELLGYVPRGQVSQEKLVTDTCMSIAEELSDLRKSADYIGQRVNLLRLKPAKGATFDAYENMHCECLPGTRSYLLRQIEEWAESPHGKCIFWLNGMAGTGKSTISRTIAKLFKGKKSLGASFFFKRGEEDRGNAKTLFPTLVHQLVARIPELIDSIQKVVEEDPYISEKALGEQFERLLLQPLSTVHFDHTVTMVIVIDALDECESEGNIDDIRAILQLLPRVRTLTRVKLRFFLTSRPELPIRLGFKEIIGNYQDMDLHDIPRADIGSDIELFLRHSFSQICEDHNFPLSWPGEDIIQTLIAKTVPLFISAATLSRFIGDRNWNPQKRLEAILADQSAYISKMSVTYLSVLKQLLIRQDEWESHQLIQEFKKIVGVIIVLATPLSVNALSQLLNIEAAHISTRLDHLHSVLNVPRTSYMPVRLLHLSFRDFLLDTKTKETRESERFWIDERAVHQYLTNQCLELMCHSLRKNICNLPGDGTERSNIDVNSINYHLPPELQYACRYWTQHLMQSQDPVTELIRAFPFLEVHFLHWVETMSILGIVSEAIEKTVYQRKISLVISTTKVEESWSAEIQTLEGHSGPINSVAISLNGQLLASSSTDGTIKLWDLTTGELHQTLNVYSNVLSVTFSPDIQLLASGSIDGIIRLWDLTTGELYQTLQDHSGPVVISPNGQLLVFSSNGQVIELWSITSQLYLIMEGYSGHSGHINSAAFSPNGGLLAFTLWDPTIGEIPHVLEDRIEAILSVTFSPNGQLLACGSSSGIKLWDLTTWKLCQTITDITHQSSSPGRISLVEFSPDGQFLTSSSGDKIIKLWNPTTGELCQTLRGHHGMVRSIAFSPTRQLLASGSNDCTIKLWDPSMDKIYQSSEDQNDWVESIAFSPSGQLLVSWGEDIIQLWDPTIGEVHRTFERDLFSQLIGFLPDGQLLVLSPLHPAYKLWDLITGKVVQIFRDGVSLPTEVIAFSPKGRLWASCSRDSDDIKLWDIDNGKLYGTFHDSSGWNQTIAFSPNGQRVALGTLNGIIKVWDLITGKLHQILKTHSSIVTSFTFSPNDRLLASCSEREEPGSPKKVQLWDSTTGELRQTFEGHSQWIWSDTNVGISLFKQQWICIQGERKLWLPPEYRPTCWAIKDGILALGHRRGKVSFISLPV